MTESPFLTAILVSYNTRHLLDECLGALRASARALGHIEIIVVDNASRDDSVAHLRAHHPDVQLIESAQNVGFGRANNLALPRVRSPYVLLLNTDAFVSADALPASLAWMETHPRCGVLGVRLTGRDGVEQPSCRRFPTPWRLFLMRTGLDRAWAGIPALDPQGQVPTQPTTCDWVPGCYYLLRREVIDQVGLFDPRFFLYYEEVDHCFAARRAGWDVTCFPGATVIHVGGESAQSDSALTPKGRQVEAIEMESALLYFRKNLGLTAVVAHVLLDSMTDVLIAIRRAASPARRHLSGEGWRRVARTWQITWATRLGARPTR